MPSSPPRLPDAATARPAPPPANDTFWPVNMYISIAATREVTTSLIAVRMAVLSELPMADQMDCDLVRSASKTPPAAASGTQRSCRLWSRTKSAAWFAAFSRAAWIAALGALRRFAVADLITLPVSSAMRAFISLARYPSRWRFMFALRPASIRFRDQRGAASPGGPSPGSQSRSAPSAARPRPSAGESARPHPHLPQPRIPIEARALLLKVYTPAPGPDCAGDVGVVWTRCW